MAWIKRAKEGQLTNRKYEIKMKCWGGTITETEYLTPLKDLLHSYGLLTFVNGEYDGTMVAQRDIPQIHGIYRRLYSIIVSIVFLNSLLHITAIV